MTPNLDSRVRLIESLQKLQIRVRGKAATFPPDGVNDCPTCGKDISFQLLGLYVSKHLPAIIEALRRMD